MTAQPTEVAGHRIQLPAEALLARDRGDTATARRRLESCLTVSPDDEETNNLPAGLEAAPVDPCALPPVRVDTGSSPVAPAMEATAAGADPKSIIIEGHGECLAGEVKAAPAFPQAATLGAANGEARPFFKGIAGERTRRAGRPRGMTSAQMLEEVDRAWQRPPAFPEQAPEAASMPGNEALLDKLDRIVCPNVSFSGMEFDRVVNTLSVVSEELDRTGVGPKSVNIVLLDPSRTNPVISLTLRNLTLRRVLDFVVAAAGFQYEVQADAVVIRPGGESSVLDTEFFPVSRATVLRLTGRAREPADHRAAAAATGILGRGGSGIEAEGPAIRNFLQLAGVNFDNTAGSSLAFDGSQLIITQDARNLDRIKNILARYSKVRQVEIESKFMEVQEGALEELGVQWNLARRSAPQQNPTTGAPLLDSSGRQVSVPQEIYSTGGSGSEALGGSVNRSIADAFRSSANASQVNITQRAVDTATGDLGQVLGQTSISSAPPSIPGGVSLGVAAGNLASLAGVVGEFDVRAVVRALSQKQGTELLSAPKLTVLSGNLATINIAQELRYPQSYGEIQSQVGTGSASGGGSAGVSITAGTPQEFTTRNVGVELRVTPTVEEDDCSISLDLNPKVTEFEGFVEYGGPSIAISGGTTMTVPPGFYQPIFSVREVTTKVTIWDGATLIMGGLTREEVKKVHDKVPFFGNIPGIGRLFRSKGESVQKRNLLIFVTASLVNPGGIPAQQSWSGVAADAARERPARPRSPGR
ncbi:MAG: hypothetical protein PHQ04_11950 [Opitutaceae bacterium]|nr:hypothetical protein [Opitutaceae bacterium]